MEKILNWFDGDTQDFFGRYKWVIEIEEQPWYASHEVILQSFQGSKTYGCFATFDDLNIVPHLQGKSSRLRCRQGSRASMQKFIEEGAIEKLSLLLGMNVIRVQDVTQHRYFLQKRILNIITEIIPDRIISVLDFLLGPLIKYCTSKRRNNCYGWKGPTKNQ